MVILGLGIYPLSEAVRYVDIPLATARAWFIQRSDGKGRGPIFKSDFQRMDNDYAISFLNLIETHVARFFRQEGVKPRIIRRAHDLLQAELQTTHPFAHADLATNGERIIKKDGNSDLIDVISRQYFFSQMNLGRIKYGRTSKMAEAWAIADGVVINPLINYGKPVIENTGVSTLIVANQYIANKEDAALVARLFRITESGVVAAFNFERSLGRVAA